jgi:uracil-DNA glycosylase
MGIFDTQPINLYFVQIDNITIEKSWKKALDNEFSKPYFEKITQFLNKSRAEDKIIYPIDSLIFNAFNLTPFEKVKVVLIGQDPYHNPGQAVGLSFSVPKEMKVPPSLRNVYKEIESDLAIERPSHGDLTNWALQGVLLLNAILTVEHKKPGSHRQIGWQHFTNAIIKLLSDRKENLIFLLWGNFAKGKREFIDETKHIVLDAAHPSPLARNAFSGCRHFSKTNEILLTNQQIPINWSLA